MAQRSRKPFRLGLDPSSYNPIGLQQYSTEELSREYARLRREATERLRKIGAGEFAYTKTYQNNKDRFKQVRDISSRRELERLTQEAARFVTARGSSASGMRAIRREAIEALHQRGYAFVNTKNFREFDEFMEFLRANAAEYATFYDTIQSRDEAPDATLTRQQQQDVREMFEDWQQRGTIQPEELEEPEDELPDSDDLEDEEPARPQQRRQQARQPSGQKTKKRRRRKIRSMR